MIISLYVDDVFIFGIDIDCINTKKFLSSVFDLKDLKIAKIILGVKIV